MRSRRQQEVWSSLGQEDADWGVLTVRDRRYQGWATNLDEFYASGVAAVDECLALMEPPALRKALDYGAGTGRLSFALAARFQSVTALDISPGMLMTLRERASAAGVHNVVATHIDEFRPLADHDFAISLLVLQHLPSLEAVSRAIALVAASLRPGGLAVIEIPERALRLRARIQPRFQAYSALRALRVSPQRLHRWGFSGISMLCVKEPVARDMFVRHGLTVSRRVERPDYDYHYIRWVVRKHG